MIIYLDPFIANEVAAMRNTMSAPVYKNKLQWKFTTTTNFKFISLKRFIYFVKIISKPKSKLYLQKSLGREVELEQNYKLRSNHLRDFQQGQLF
jgi:hypothetical protein